MNKYYRVMLGRNNAFVKDCLAGNFIGVDFNMHQDLSGQLSDDWRDFNRNFIPVFLSSNQDKAKVAAGLACGTIWTLGKDMQRGDLVLSPDGEGHYHVAEVTGNYQYEPGGKLPHRRSVQWLVLAIEQNVIGDALKHAAGVYQTQSAIFLATEKRSKCS